MTAFKLAYRLVARSLCLTAIAGWTMSGCSSFYDSPETSDSHFEAARILLSARSVIPWESIAPQMTPAFQNVTGDSMYTKVLPTAQVGTDQIVSALLASLQISLPSTGTTVNKVTDLATGDVTGTKTESETPGTVPTPTSPPAAPNAKDIGALSGFIDKIENDPVLSYELANGLFQRVMLLNQELQKMAIEQGKQAFLVGVDLDVQPYKRKQPYDVFVDISFFPYQQIFSQKLTQVSQSSTAVMGSVVQTLTEAQKNDTYCQDATLPEVFPLLYMDNVSLTAQNNAVENITQLNLALSGMMSGIGGAFNTNYDRDALQALVGNDRNGLFTLGKSSVNTLAARIGAPRQVAVEYELQAQSHRIYSLILVPKQYLKCYAPSLHVVAQSTLVDGRNGKPLDLYKDREFTRAIKNALEYYGVDSSAVSPQSDEIKRVRAAVVERNFGNFIAAIIDIMAATEADIGADDRESRARLIADIAWQDVQNLNSRFGLTYERIALPGTSASPTSKGAPAKQTVIAEVRGAGISAKTAIALIGDEGLTPNTDVLYRAQLEITPPGKTEPDILPANPTIQSLLSANRSTALPLEFDSLLRLGYAKDIKGGAQINLRLKAESDDPKRAWEMLYPVRFVNQEWVAAAPQDPPKLTIVKPARFVVATAATGKGSAAIFVEMKGLKKVVIKVVGGDWDQHPGNTMTIIAPQSIDLNLSNLVDGEKVVVTAEGFDDANNNIKNADPVELMVRAQTQKAANP